MARDPFIPTREDLGVVVRATVTGKVVSVETGFIDVETSTTTFARLDPTQATWERVAPVEWPPQPGDLWRDRHGEPWFIYVTVAGVRARAREFLGARDAHGGFVDHDVEAHLLTLAPLTLMVRDSKVVEL